MSDQHYMPQMSLGLSVNDGCQFSNFYSNQQSEILISTLKRTVDSPCGDFIYVCGASGSGKTHLLLATYHYAQSLQVNAGYLPLEEFVQYSPKEALIIYSETNLLLIDGLEFIADDAEWQEALFDLYNNRKDKQLATVFSAQSPVAELKDIQLNDLKTRLSSCLSFQIPVLSDTELEGFLHFVTQLRGMIVNEQCIQFIILRAQRSPQSLMILVEQLDRAQLSAGRRITVPFIKELFNW